MLRLIFCLSLFALFYPKNVIEVRNETNYCYLHSDHFRLKWKHSVEQQYWLEDYQLKEGKIHLYQTFFQTFGAGSPSSLPPITAPAGYIGYKQNQVFEHLNWVVSSNVESTIQTTKGDFLIYQLLPDYSQVHISVQRKPFFFLLWENHCL